MNDIDFFNDAFTAFIEDTFPNITESKEGSVVYYKHLDELLANQEYSLHIFRVSKYDLVAVLLHSCHHESETVCTENEFLRLFLNPSPEHIDQLNQWTKDHPFNPFFAYGSCAKNAIYTMDKSLGDSKRDNTFAKDLEDWKTFIDKMARQA